MPSIFELVEPTPFGGPAGARVALPPVERANPVAVEWEPEDRGRFFDEAAGVWRGHRVWRPTFRLAYGVLDPAQVEVVARFLLLDAPTFEPWRPQGSAGGDVWPVEVEGNRQRVCSALRRTARLSASLRGRFVYTTPWGSVVEGNAASYPSGQVQ